jgi:hypothetical protein
MLQIKFNSFASNKNKMKKLLFIAVFLFNGLSSWSQSIQEEKAIATSSKKITLDKKMNFRVLNAFQNNSKSKVEDLFGYFQLLTNATVDDDLKKEVIKTTQQLYKTTNTKVIDFTSKSRELIPLHQFLQKLLISEPILFSISDETQYNSVTENSWTTSYTVTRTKSGVTSKIKVNQTVYFFDETKQFGTSSKYVQSTYLGEMQ